MKKAFTLIELLVVLAIIGILAALVFTSLRLVVSESRETAVLAEVKQLQTRAHIYNVEFDVYGTPGIGTDCDSGLFADSEINRISESIVAKSGAAVTCAIGEGGTTFAMQFDSIDFGTLCVDTFNIRSQPIDWEDALSPVLCEQQ